MFEAGLMHFTLSPVTPIFAMYVISDLICGPFPLALSATLEHVLHAF
jgi:hypothetical protein